MSSRTIPCISAENEWSALRSVIVGRAGKSCFPSEPQHMIEATMPAEHWAHFKPSNPFDEDILKKADEELDQLAALLEEFGVKVYRPEHVDWLKVHGYTAAMPRDGMLTVGNHIIEAPFAWSCRAREIDLAFSGILETLASDPAVRVVRAPARPSPDTIYDGLPVLDAEATAFGDSRQPSWAVNNTRPSFDAADFMRFGKTLLGQLSHVTNQAGVAWLQQSVPVGYNVEIVEVHDPHAMHIDATLLPLRQGLLVYNPERVSEAALRKHQILKDWRLLPYPFQPTPRDWPPRYMTSGWLLMNVLSLDSERVIVEAADEQFSDFIRGLGLKPIPMPFQHVHSIGGPFHCATVDLVREEKVQIYG